MEAGKWSEDDSSSLSGIDSASDAGGSSGGEDNVAVQFEHLYEQSRLQVIALRKRLRARPSTEAAAADSSAVQALTLKLQEGSKQWQDERARLVSLLAEAQAAVAEATVREKTQAALAASRVADAEAKFQQVVADVGTVTARCRDLEAESTTLRREVTAAREAAKEAQEVVAAKVAEVQDDTGRALESQQAAWSLERKTMQATVASYKAKAATAEQRATTLDAELSRVRSDLENTRTVVRRLQAQVSRAEQTGADKDVASPNSDIKQLKRLWEAKLATQQEEADMRLDLINDELAAANADVKSMRQKYEVARANHAASGAEIDALTAERAELRAEQERLRHAVAQAASDAATRAAALAHDSWQSERKDLRRQLRKENNARKVAESNSTRQSNMDTTLLSAASENGDGVGDVPNPAVDSLDRAQLLRLVHVYERNLRLERQLCKQLGSELQRAKSHGEACVGDHDQRSGDMGGGVDADDTLRVCEGELPSSRSSVVSAPATPTGQFHGPASRRQHSAASVGAEDYDAMSDTSELSVHSHGGFGFGSPQVSPICRFTSVRLRSQTCTQGGINGRRAQRATRRASTAPRHTHTHRVRRTELRLQSVRVTLHMEEEDNQVGMLLSCANRRDLSHANHANGQKEVLQLLSEAHRHGRLISSRMLGRVRVVINRLTKARHQAKQALLVCKKQVGATRYAKELVASARTHGSAVLPRTRWRICTIASAQSPWTAMSRRDCSVMHVCVRTACNTRSPSLQRRPLFNAMQGWLCSRPRQVTRWETTCRTLADVRNLQLIALACGHVMVEQTLLD